MNKFHRNLNRMALFTALVVCCIILFYREFFAIATANIYLNGAILGTTIFGIIFCFIRIFSLVPEYRWLNAFTCHNRRARVAPRLLHGVAVLLRTHPQKLTESGLHSALGMIQTEMEDEREPIRYITNTLVFLGLLGTFWGLILTVGGFADLIRNLNFNDDTVLHAMQAGLSQPLGGMATAFTSSLLGLGGSLVIGFLGVQVEMAQSAIFHATEDVLARRTNVNHPEIGMWPRIESSLDKINNAIQEINQQDN
ncbi:MAG: MotA/TolQ/ExbB proton channel family protein [Alphaproteobacteria bacterium]|nr:MotA/TolQ/ExbB proton channel family protein [Alphaproteobacteria bacterium]